MPVFDPDSKFMTITNTMLDYVKLGLLVVLGFIPIFTAGASITAAMTVAMKIERGEAPVIWKPYKEAWKKNFRQSAFFTIVLFLIFTLLGFDWYLVMQMESTGMIKAARAVIFFMALLFTMIGMYVFATIARYDLTNKAVFRNAVIYSLLNFPKNLVAVAILVIGSLAYSYLKTIVPIVICLIPALELYYMAKVCVHTFSKLEGVQEETQEGET